MPKKTTREPRCPACVALDTRRKPPLLLRGGTQPRLWLVTQDVTGLFGSYVCCAVVVGNTHAHVRRVLTHELRGYPADARPQLVPGRLTYTKLAEHPADRTSRVVAVQLGRDDGDVS